MARLVRSRRWVVFLLAVGLLCGCELQQKLTGEPSRSPTLQLSGGMEEVPSASAKAKHEQRAGQAEKQPSAPQNENYVYTTTYQVKVPDSVQVRYDPGDVVFLLRDGKTIGGIQVYSFYAEEKDISRLFPRNSTPLATQPLANNKAVRYVLERHLADHSGAASGSLAGETAVREHHTYFLRQPLAYDVWIVEGALSEDTYEEMLKSFSLFSAGRGS